MAREIAAVNKCSETEAVKQIEQNLAKSPSRMKAAAEAAQEEDDSKEEAA
jgi:CarD family transcriptional regulator